MEALHGLLVVDKPGGLTSRDVVNRAQGWFPRRTRLGHTGTLDPLATGVLVLCVGVATRLAEYVQDMDKTYRAGIRLGVRSDTDDADGTVQPLTVDRPPDLQAVREALHGFVGEIAQVPPTYSATKVTGARAYQLARRGQEVMLRPRRVQVYGIDLLAYAYPRLEIDVRCGKGTYIRSLARDLGERLGCGALVESLRRMRVGPFRAEQALGLHADAATARDRLLPIATAVCALPRATLNTADMARVRQGQALPLDERNVPPDANALALVDPEGKQLVAVAAVDRVRQVLRPVKVLPALASPQQGPSAKR
jgi:tRNA pseudouridine55 synthase